MRRRMLHKASMLAVGPYRFIWYINNSGLVAKVEDKTGSVWKVSYSHLLLCLSMPQQVQIGELLVDIVDEDAGERSMGATLPTKTPEPPVDVASPLGYPETPAGGAEWSSSLSSIMLFDSDNEQLLGTV